MYYWKLGLGVGDGQSRHGRGVKGMKLQVWGNVWGLKVLAQARASAGLRVRQVIGFPQGRRGDVVQDAVAYGSALPDHELALGVGDDSFSRVGSWSPVVCRKPGLWNLRVVRECRPRAALCASVSWYAWRLNEMIQWQHWAPCWAQSRRRSIHVNSCYFEVIYGKILRLRKAETKAKGSS